MGAVSTCEKSENRKDGKEMKKQELMCLCRDINEVHDCGLCRYEYTDTCSLNLEKIRKELKKIREKERMIKNETIKRNC